MIRVPVLIVGAGPTGLVLAIALAARGIAFRLVDAAEKPGEHSRAMVVHARTLEFYRQFGFADRVIGEGLALRDAQFRESTRDGSREILSFTFADLGTGISPYPLALVYPQDDHERMLQRQLEARGGRVERNTRLVSFERRDDGVRARLATPSGEEMVEADFLCGCDGAHSAVRAGLHLGFGGGTYEQLYFVADVALDGGFERTLIVNAGTAAFTLLMPVRSSGMQRLIGLLPTEADDRTTFADIRAEQERLIDRRIADVHWFSTYRVHHRVADHFAVGRVFVLGDAGHLHSPAGGQGMNTGIGDAINLGWKLAEVVRERAPVELLESYETERIRFARALVATTDRAFGPIVAGGLIGDLTRRIALPLFFGLGTKTGQGRHALFRLLSQTQIEYHDSQLSDGGDVAGERLPWVGDLTPDNYEPLRSLDWQVHVYGASDTRLAMTCEAERVPLERFAFTDGARKAGIERDVAYLVRPDGHVALVFDPRRDHDALRRYREQRGLTFGQ